MEENAQGSIGSRETAVSADWNLAWKLQDGTEIAVENQSNYTIVCVERSVPGQFEQTQNTTDSGQWLVPPQVTQTGEGVTIEIQATHGNFVIEIEDMNIEVTSDVETAPPVMMPLIMPLTSLPPHRSNLDDRATPIMPFSMPSRSCTCCGHTTQPDDRFCAHCGHKLIADGISSELSDESRN